MTLIANGTHWPQILQLPSQRPPLRPPSGLQISTPRTFYMASLIEGWFQLANSRPFVDNFPDTTTSSPRKNKSYLSLYDSCAILGSISSEVFVECELRLFPGNHALEQKVVHAHGRFSVITPANEDKPRLQVEIHRFVVMDMIDPSSADTPEGLRTSVALSGRVVSVADATVNPADKFFMLEVSDYIRDHIQAFNIRFAAFSSLS
jgi:hypothetical protein